MQAFESVPRHGFSIPSSSTSTSTTTTTVPRRRMSYSSVWQLLELGKTLIGRYSRVIRFLTVGGIGAIINLTFVWLGMRLWNSLPMASALGIIVSIFSNFCFNKWWTFQDRKAKHDDDDDNNNNNNNNIINNVNVNVNINNKTKNKWLELLSLLLQYYLGSGLAVLMQLSVTFLIYNYLFQVIYVAQMLGIFFGTGINFYVQNYWTFAESKNQPKTNKQTIV